jgi:hypothetical protein
VVLDPGTVSDFYRKQIRDNLALIAQTASSVAGHPVQVQLGPDSSATPADAPAAQSGVPDARPVSNSAGEDLMQRLQREPVVRSFLDKFPGPVKAEKIDT